MMLAQVLEKNGVKAKFAAVAALASEMVQAVEAHGAQYVCISALPPSALTHARYLCKRLRARGEELDVTVGLWNSKVDPKKAQAKLGCTDRDRVVTTLAEAVAQLKPLVVADETAKNQAAPAGAGAG
jgi:hypothetical protein